MPEMFQTVILTLKDGRKVQYSGPVQMEGGESCAVVDIAVTPGKPLPEGCSWEYLKPKGK